MPLTDASGAPFWITVQAPDGAPVTVSAQNTGATGDITCVIEVDGIEVKRVTSSGGYVVASCSSVAD